MILDKIVLSTRKKVAEEKEQLSINRIIKELEEAPTSRNFKEAINKENTLSVIAEIKRASPSKGIIKEAFNPLKIAKAYEENRVEAISVLTEEGFFQGNKGYLRMVRGVTTVPLLRKDFIIDDYQIYQSKHLGADVILFIAAILSKEQLIDYQRIARELGLYSLVEVHNLEELDKALEAEAEIIGINNRDLKTFETNLRVTETLICAMPKGKIVISESGIHTNQDMRYLKGHGVKGVLVGESLMRARSIEEKLQELRRGLDD